MPIEPLMPEHQRHLIIPCKHEGISFYAFVDVDYVHKQFIVSKTFPEIRADFIQKIPFARITESERDHEPLSDALCEAIIQELVLHFNN